MPAREDRSRGLEHQRGPRLILDLDLSDDYLSGTVTAGQQPDRPFTGRLGLLAAIEAEVARLSAAGCGDDDGGDSGQQAVKPEKRVDVNKDPQAITCSDLADEVASARLSRTATFTLADQALARNPKLAETSNRNLLAQRIFIGMTELCETGEPDDTPAADAVAGVVAGRYQLNPDDDKYVGE